jgi:hypothetical protein
MHWLEFDRRIDPLHHVIVGIGAGLAEIQRQMDDKEWFDGLHAREEAEPLLGLGFVAFQTYAVGTVSDLNQIRRGRDSGKLTLKDCYACDPVKMKGVVTRLELIHSTANYFKHHDQWPKPWPTSSTAKTRMERLIAENVNTLGVVGITEKTEFPCIDAVDLLCGTSWELIVLHQILKEWRAHLFSTLL